MLAVRTDEDIKSDIVEHLLWDGRVDASDIAVTVTDGRVVLTGPTENYFAQRAAVEDAWSVRGVRDVIDEMRPGSGGTAGPVSDTELKLNAETALRVSSDVDASNVEVDAKEGAVRLTGSVPAYWRKIRAQEIVASLQGTRAVDNQITVVPQETAEDAELADRVKAAIARNVVVEGDAINIKVDQGVVTLAGTVPTAAGRIAAVNTAGNTEGTLDVVDEIEVAGYPGTEI